MTDLDEFTPCEPRGFWFLIKGFASLAMFWTLLFVLLAGIALLAEKIFGD